MKQDLTQGSVFCNLLRFSLPYLLSCFLQTFYGLADLFIAGRFNGSGTITAVSVGSQVTHMLTVIIIGLAMGSTVLISRAVGAKNYRDAARGIGNTITIFLIFSFVFMGILLFALNGILRLLSTPAQAWQEAKSYLMVCFIGVPFITAYNVISSIFRGLGDTRRPMYFIGIAGIINVILDYILIGGYGLGALGAAIATVFSQGISVIIALFSLRKQKMGIILTKQDYFLDFKFISRLLKIGVPVALQDGLIQISFLVITVIANRRSLDVAAAVGIVEKLIGFFFLVPSAMLSSVSALAAQNAGADKHQRSRQTLYYGIILSVGVGGIFTVLCQFQSENILWLFAKQEPEVIVLGSQYLRSYILDCAIAGIHFCFSGYFCAYQRSMLSFLHNIVSIVLIRIPGAYLASLWFPDTLYPMGAAAPAGSLLSAILCVVFYRIIRRDQQKKVVANGRENDKIV